MEGRDNDVSKTVKIILLLILCVVIAVVPLLLIHDSEFGGADGAAEDAVADIDPEYEAWAESIIQLPGGETESLLFCVQAALGSGVLFFCIGYLAARKKYTKTKDEI